MNTDEHRSKTGGVWFLSVFICGYSFRPRGLPVAQRFDIEARNGIGVPRTRRAMARKIGVDMGGSWVRVGVLTPGPDGGTLHVEKHASPTNWDELVAVL